MFDKLLIMHKLIFHELPRIGKVCIPLSKESKYFFEELENKGLIKYLMSIKQLGYINYTFPAQNHTRFDYCILQMHLIQLLSKTFPNLSLTADLIPFKAGKISTKVFLQIWILVSNIGHLPETTPAEKALCSSLKSKYKSLLDSELFNNKYSDDIIKDVFEFNNYYKLKYLLGLDFFLKTSETRECTREILRFLSHKDNENSKIWDKLTILDRIRRISYLYLDSLNGDYPISFDIVKIITNISNYPILFDPNSREYDRFIESCEAELMKKIYIAEKAMPHFFYTYSNRVRYFESLIEINPELPLLKQLGSNPKIGSSYQLANQILPLQIYLNFDELVLFGKTQSIHEIDYFRKIHSYESSLNHIIPSNLKSTIKSNILFDQGRKFIFLNFLVYKNKINVENIKDVLFVYFKIIERFKVDCKDNILSDSDKDTKSFYTQMLFHDFNRKAVLQSLKLIFNYHFDIRITLSNRKHFQHPLGKIIEGNGIIDNVIGCKKILNRINLYKEETTQYFSPSELNSLKCLESYLTSKHSLTSRHKYYYSFGPIKLVDVIQSPKTLNEQGNPFEFREITDIDCLLISFTKEHFEYILFEGKNSKRYKGEINECFAKLKTISLIDLEKNATCDYINNNKLKAKGGYICFN